MNETLLLTKGTFMTTNPYLISIVIAIVIFISGLIIGRIVSKTIKRLFTDIKIDSKLKRKIGLKVSFQKLILIAVEFSIYILFTGIALNYIGLSSLVLNILLIAIIIILSISFILALKDSVPNIIAGFIIRKKSRLNIEDKILIDNIEGTILETNLFEVRIKRTNGDIFYIPNSYFIKQKYTKLTNNKTKNN